MEAPPPALRRPSRIAGAEWALVGAIFLAAFLPVLLTANHYGPTYDEPHYASAGLSYAEWWGRVFRGDVSAFRQAEIEAAWILNHEHPPLQKCSSGFAQRWFGAMLPGLAAIRLPSALWFALAACSLYLFTRGIWGRRGALFAALAFMTMPRVFAHAHLLALDMPIAAWFFITAALMSHALKRNSWPWALLAGLAFGFALMSKLNAFFLPVLLLPWGLVYHRARWPKMLAALLLVGPAVFWMGWPWLWIDFVPHLREYLAFHARHAAYNVWYLGRIHEYAPWHYPLVMAAVATPALLLAMAALGAVQSWRRRRTDPDRTLLLLGLAVALLPSVLPTSPKYNGIRLFLPAFPFLAALAGGGFAFLQERIVGRLWSDRPEAARLSVLICVVVGAALLWPGMAQVRLTHPYQLAYYSSAVGGARGAAERGFETIYWGQVFQEAPDFLNAIGQPNPRVLVIPKGVIYLLEFQQQAGLLRGDIQFTGEETEAEDVDYVMFQAMQSDYTDLCWALVKEAQPAYALRLGETALLLAYDRTAVTGALERLDR
jgi:hypothetical protein